MVRTKSCCCLGRNFGAPHFDQPRGEDWTPLLLTLAEWLPATQLLGAFVPSEAMTQGFYTSYPSSLARAAERVESVLLKPSTNSVTLEATDHWFIFCVQVLVLQLDRCLQANLHACCYMHLHTQMHMYRHTYMCVCD